MPTSIMSAKPENEHARLEAAILGLQHWLDELDSLGLGIPAVHVAEAIAALGGKPSAGPAGFE